MIPIAQKTLTRLYNKVISNELTLKDRQTLLRALRELNVLRAAGSTPKRFKSKAEWVPDQPISNPVGTDHATFGQSKHDPY